MFLDGDVAYLVSAIHSRSPTQSLRPASRRRGVAPPKGPSIALATRLTLPVGQRSGGDGLDADPEAMEKPLRRRRSLHGVGS
jgi:hypothetical protein